MNTRTAEDLHGRTCEEAFARLATAKEKAGGIHRHRGFASIPQRIGFEVVYKPYGEQGAGYYYHRVIAA